MKFCRIVFKLFLFFQLICLHVVSKSAKTVKTFARFSKHKNKRQSHAAVLVA